jgi:hypothetical protein
VYGSMSARGVATARGPTVARRCAAVIAALAAVAALAPGAFAQRDPYPHEFLQNNMGYCAPYLAQLQLPDGRRVRPFLNDLLRTLTAQGFEGQRNLGDFYSDKARSQTDQQCIDRTGGTS